MTDKTGNGNAPTAKPSNAPAQEPRAKTNPNAVQSALLGAMRGRRVSLTFVDGSQVAGILKAYDQYSLALADDATGERVELVYKQGLARVRIA